MSEGSRKAIAASGKTYTVYITVHGGVESGDEAIR